MAPITPENKEYKKLEDLLKEVITRTIDMWSVGEGDLSIEIRDVGEKNAKISGGHTTRIR